MPHIAAPHPFFVSCPFFQPKIICPSQLTLLNPKRRATFLQDSIHPCGNFYLPTYNVLILPRGTLPFHGVASTTHCPLIPFLRTEMKSPRPIFHFSKKRMPQLFTAPHPTSGFSENPFPSPLFNPNRFPSSLAQIVPLAHRILASTFA